MKYLKNPRAAFVLCIAGLAAVLSCLVVLAAASQALDNHQAVDPGTASHDSELQPLDFLPIFPGGEHHKPLRMRMDYAGVTEPLYSDAKSATMDDALIVIGVVVDGEAYAFSRDALANPTRHIVNVTIRDAPISVTYCDLVDCVRVLTNTTGTGSIDLHVGGLDVDHQMVFLLDGVRYGQSSTELPLQDYPFEITTLEDWKARYPQTKIYEPSYY